MGAYLSEPMTNKTTEEAGNAKLRYGSGEMQGWRISQEDAHNAIIDFDVDTSLFAVYDGHGGSEVSAYCAMKFPEYLKKVAAYAGGDFEQALQDAFIGFDATLLQETVIEELKLLAKKNPEVESPESEGDEEENLIDLCQEAHMPLKDVLEKYKGASGNVNPDVLRLQSDPTKPISPYLRGRRALRPGAEAGGSSGGSNGGAGCSSSSSSTSEPRASSSRRAVDIDDATVSSSSSSQVEQVPVKAKASAEVESSDWAGSNGKNDIPDSSSTNKKPEVGLASSDSSEVSQSVGASVKPVETATNGDISGSDAVQSGLVRKGDDEAKIESSTGPAKGESVSSSSSSGVYENGEVSSNTNNGDHGASSAAAVSVGGSLGSSNSISSTETINADSSTDESDEEAAYEENSDTEEGEEDADLEEMDSEEEEDEDPILTEEDEEFMNNMVDEPGKDSGCTAVVALLRGNDLYVANAGDSRCVVCRKGEAIEMSLDHKPEDQIEFERIKNAGGRVTLDGRVNGGLNLSRAIGDHGYKMNKSLPAEKQMISALPDVKKLTLTPDDEFMILACDGIWNFMSSEEVVEFVRAKLTEKPDIKLTQICEELFDHCLAPNTMGDGTGCDNMTAIIVQFTGSKIASSGVKRSAESSIENQEKSESEAKRPRTETANDDPTQAPIVDTSS